MQRKEFLKRLGLGTMIIPMIAAACGNDDPAPDKSASGDTSADACTESPTETAGPFPTKTPSGLVMTDIRSDRTGVNLTINITVQDVNNNCSALSDATVDIWHCDKDGYYSEYGGTTMQSVNYQSVHFLRGRQSTDENGLVSFLSIFPGWYSGRAPHIHIHIYDKSGNSLLVTQIAFPTDLCNTVYTTATQYYTKGTQDTANGSDNIFADSLSQELATLSGSVNDGYTLTHTIKVEG